MVLYHERVSNEIALIMGPRLWVIRVTQVRYNSYFNNRKAIMATSFRAEFQEADDAPRTLAQAFKRAKVIAQPANVMSNDNPTKDGACNWDKRVKADYKKLGPTLGKLIDMRVIAYPKGAFNEHVLHMQYENGHATYNGERRVETFA